MDKTLNIPQHIAIIMDGNGRWAKKHGYDRSYGHLMGVESVKTIIDESLRLGVKCLTLYAFSSENWSRPAKEVEYLMELFCSTIIQQKELLIERGVRVLFMGREQELSDKVRQYVNICQQETAQNNTMILNVALNYSSQNELVDASRKIAEMVKKGDLSLHEITEKTITDSLYTASLPELDLIIRTSGELRLSNFMLWQASYSEFYFTDVLWPDFGAEQYLMAIEDYTKRKRRFGNI